MLNAPKDSYERPAPLPPVGAYLHGGAPLRDPAIERALSDELPPLIAEAALLRQGDSRADETSRKALLANLDHDAAFASHGPALAASWHAMLGSLDRWMVLTPSDRNFVAYGRELRARIDAVSDQFAAAELAYYIDPEIVSDPNPRRHPGIFAYRVERVSFVRSNDRAPIRVFEARQLGATHSGHLLGINEDELDDPVVLLDAVDAKIKNQILPLLAGDAFGIADSDWAYSYRGRQAEAAATVAIRDELLAALYTEADNPDKAAARTQELVAASVRHHEAQHKIDREHALRYPPELSTRLGEKKNDPFAVRSRYELSAYLSQIASDQWLPQLTLWNLVRHGFHRGARREESYVAVVVVEGLARQLGIPSVGAIVKNDGSIDQDRLAELAIPLARKSTAELRSAATKVWADLFGEPLVRLYD
ncbi:MAG TPA: hypothetical protein VGM39_23645 [Kofleriaceae bacterium]